MDNSTIKIEQLDSMEPTKMEPADNLESRKKVEKKSIKINVKALIIVIVIIALGVVAYLSRGLIIAATVDGSTISRLTVIHELEKVSGKSLLDSLITEKLINNEALAKGITVSDEEVNAEIKNIEDQIAAQGSTLEAALTTQNMTLEDLKKQIIVQKKIEKLVADKINVTDEEVAKYINDNKITIPAGQEVTTATQIKNELKNQKISAEAATLITTLKSQAKIHYFVNY
jgi:parvulin-like peptidyl-prolyl isomerase